MPCHLTTDSKFINNFGVIKPFHSVVIDTFKTLVFPTKCLHSSWYILALSLPAYWSRLLPRKPFYFLKHHINGMECSLFERVFLVCNQLWRWIIVQSGCHATYNTKYHTEKEISPLCIPWYQFHPSQVQKKAQTTSIQISFWGRYEMFISFRNFSEGAQSTNV